MGLPQPLERQSRISLSHELRHQIQHVAWFIQRQHQGPYRSRRRELSVLMCSPDEAPDPPPFPPPQTGEGREGDLVRNPGFWSDLVCPALRLTHCERVSLHAGYESSLTKPARSPPCSSQS